MSLSLNIIYGLELAGIVSGCYVGYKYGDVLKKTVCHKYPFVEKYRRDYLEDKFKHSQISEKNMFDMIGAFSGILLGYRGWFITIPILVYKASEDYPDEVVKIKKFFGR